MPRRHPLTIYKVDTDDVADMWLRARNQFKDNPQLLSRPMVIVPTYKDVEKAIAGLQYLDSSITWSEVSRKSPNIPKTGGMVCTPYVQTGLDIKPPPTILIDSGRDVVIHKGRKVSPNPYTDAKTNEQRTNRVGRIMEGVVIQPEGAGTGTQPVNYPSGLFFSSELVARQYKVPMLTKAPKPVHPEIPFMEIRYDAGFDDPDKNRKEKLSVTKSLMFLHLMALNGVERKDWMHRYTRYFDHRLPLSEDEDHLERIIESGPLKYTAHIPVNRAMHLLESGHVTWYIEGVPRVTRPLFPIDGMWQEEPGGYLKDTRSVKLDHVIQDKQINQWQKENQILKKEASDAKAKLATLEEKLSRLLNSNRGSAQHLMQTIKRFRCSQPPQPEHT